jgi:hypothetical protein
MFLAHEFNDEEKQEATFFKDFLNEISWGFVGLPERLQHMQRFQLADLLALDQTDARMGNGQELNIGVLSRTLWWNEDNN